MLVACALAGSRRAAILPACSSPGASSGPPPSAPTTSTAPAPTAAPARPLPIDDAAVAKARAAPPRPFAWLLVPPVRCLTSYPCGLEFNDLAEAPDGSFFVAGAVFGKVAFGDQTVQAASMRDSFFVHVSPTGQLLGTNRYTGRNNDWIDRVAVGADGVLHVAGAYTAGFSLGGPRLPDPTVEPDLSMVSYLGVVTAEGKHVFSAGPILASRISGCPNPAIPASSGVISGRPSQGQTCSYT